MNSSCGRLAKSDVATALFSLGFFAFGGYLATELSKFNRSLVIFMVPTLTMAFSLAFYAPLSISIYLFRARLSQRDMGFRSMISLTVTFASYFVFLATYVGRANYEVFVTLGPLGIVSMVALGGLMAFSLSVYVHVGVPTPPKVAKLLVHIFVLLGLISFWIIVFSTSLGVVAIVTLKSTARWDHVLEFLRRDLSGLFGLLYFAAPAVIGALDYFCGASSSRSQGAQNPCGLHPLLREQLHELLGTLMARYVIYLPDEAYHATVEIIERAISLLQDSRSEPGGRRDE